MGIRLKLSGCVLFLFLGFFRAFPRENPGQDASASVHSVREPDLCLFRPGFGERFVHRVGAGGRVGKVITSNKFLRGENRFLKPIDSHWELHAKYSFQFREGTLGDALFGSAYQGVGISSNFIEDRTELGQPWSFYLFQGSRIHRFSPRFSLFYEWNFGYSMNWTPYDFYTNSFNVSIGSRGNAYIGLILFAQWRLNHAWDLETGLSFSHFSNGNTSLPNAGLNMTSLNVDLVYHFGRRERNYETPVFPPFGRSRRGMVYDLVAFGSWKQDGTARDGRLYKRNFAVAGLSFSPLYTLGRRVRVGGAVDMIYDTSDHVLDDEDLPYVFFEKKNYGDRILVSLSGKIDYVMPYFTLSGGMGFDLMNVDKQEKAFFQTMTLKIDLYRNSFLNIGYRLQNFRTPRFLMLGVGYRFGGEQ